MTAYIILIIYIFLLSLIFKSVVSKREKQEKLILFWSFIAIFLILALKKETVGIDISGYKEQFEISRYKAWNDVNYVYFEAGYITLMKIFSKLGFTFQQFMALMYGLCSFSWYFFLKKYSKNAMLSVLMFICYDFFVFNISGVRQMIATSLCLFAYLLFCKTNWIKIVCAVLLVLMASSIHQSAFIFLVVIAFEFLNEKCIYFHRYLICLIAAIPLRKYVLSFISTYFFRDYTSTSVDLGGSFIFQVCIVFLMSFPFWVSTANKKNLTIERRPTMVIPEDIKFMRLSLLTLIFNVLLSGSTLLRGVMYLRVFMIVGLPNAIERYEMKTQLLLNMVLDSFLVALFYLQTLMPNQLDLCPYMFFWQ